MKAIKKIAAIVMAMVMAVSSVPSSFATDNSNMGELYKLFMPSYYAEYKLGSTIVGII